jgi:hypothetical protein
VVLLLIGVRNPVSGFLALTAVEKDEGCLGKVLMRNS